MCIFLLCLGFHSKAQATLADILETHQVEFALGAQYSSILHKRGIVTYDGYQLLPIYALSFWDPQVVLAGTALHYKHYLTEDEKNIFRIRLYLDATLDKPLYYTRVKENKNIERETTTELDLFYEYQTSLGSFLRFQWSQDLVASKGSYVELRGFVPFYNFLEGGENNKPILQPGLFVSVGAGNKKHNEYLYGVGAEDSFGVNNVEYGLYVLSPRAIDSLWPVVKITHFELKGDKNQTASFVKFQDGDIKTQGKHKAKIKGWQIEALFAFRLL